MSSSSGTFHDVAVSEEGEQEEAPGGAQAPARLPRSQFFTVWMITLNECFVENVMWAFAPYMVRDFGVAEQEIGLYVGILASSYFAVQCGSSLLWGLASDRFGRRPSILVGLAGTIGSIIWFGCARSFGEAVAARCLSGLLNGNLAVTKSYVAEATTPATKVAGFSVLTLAWGIGGVVAPMIGGLLSQTGQLFGSDCSSGSSGSSSCYNYLLPCFATAGLGSVALVLGFRFLPEPAMSSAGESRDSGDSGESSSIGLKGRGSNQDACESGFLFKNEGTTKRDGATAASTTFSTRTPSTVANESTELQQRRGPAAATSNNACRCCCCCDSSVTSVPLVCSGLLCERNVLLSTSCYGLTCMIWVMFDETFALFCQTAISFGGLGLSVQEIGLLLAVVGTTIVAFQVTCYHPVALRVGNLMVYRASVLCTMPFFLLFPLLNWVTRLAPDSAWSWIAIVLSMVLRGVITSAIYMSICLCVNNSQSASRSGTVNGIAASFCALGRAVGPFLAGLVWSWSLGLQHDALEFVRHTFLYVVIALFTALNYALARMLPASLEYVFEHECGGSGAGVGAAVGCDEAASTEKPKRCPSTTDSSPPEYHSYLDIDPLEL